MDNKKTVGFYKLITDEEHKRMIGALLVTDDLGKPEEFRVTYPVKPTLLQRQLYGASLFPHVGMELCGLPLYETLRSKPALLVVSHPDFLLLSDAINTPVVFLERAGHTLTVSVLGENTRPQQDKFQSATGRFEPIQVTYPITYREDRRGKAAELVIDFFNGIDLLEPFSRIDIAIRVLQEQDERFR
jgi:hypothetical protein